jgi:hypothetical protein
MSAMPPPPQPSTGSKKKMSKTKKIVLGVVGAFLVIGVIGAIAGPKSKQPASSAAPTLTSSTSPPATTSQTTAAPHPSAPPTAAAPTFGSLVFMDVNSAGYTVGFVARNGDVTAWTPKDKGLPTDCDVKAVAVAKFSNRAGAWTGSAEAPKDLIGSEPESLMATFYGRTNGAYRFTANMNLAPEFHTIDYYGANFTRALVLHEDCSF